MMKSSTHDKAEECVLCGLLLVPTSFEEWRTADGQSIAIPKAEVPYVLAETSNGEICVCEKCYAAGRCILLPERDLVEVHYEFGVEYQALGRFSDSVDALHRGLKLKRTADMLAAIAQSYGELGDRALERTFYEQALALDPNHFIARENLKTLNS